MKLFSVQSIPWMGGDEADTDGCRSVENTSRRDDVTAVVEWMPGIETAAMHHSRGMEITGLTLVNSDMSDATGISNTGISAPKKSRSPGWSSSTFTSTPHRACAEALRGSNADPVQRNNNCVNPEQSAAASVVPPHK